MCLCVCVRVYVCVCVGDTLHPTLCFQTLLMLKNLTFLYGLYELIIVIVPCNLMYIIIHSLYPIRPFKTNNKNVRICLCLMSYCLNTIYYILGAHTIHEALKTIVIYSAFIVDTECVTLPATVQHIPLWSSAFCQTT